MSLNFGMSEKNGMNVCVSAEECRVSLERVDAMTMEVDQATEPDREYDSDKLRRDPQRGDEERGLSGPDRPNEGRVTRSRSSSINSVSSGGASGAAAALAASRRSRRSDSFNENRRSTTTAKNPGSEEGGSTVVLSDDTGDDEEFFFSPSTSREPSLKRKITDGEEIPEVVRRKQGRPPTSSEFIGLAKAKEAYNKELRESIELEREAALRKMSAAQLFVKHERNVIRCLEELENAPTADVAHRIREQMAEVIRVARTSGHLSGPFVKTLKDAAAYGAAAAEVLRTRSDSAESGDTSWQLKAMRREIEEAKQEARAARKESETLRKELAEAKAQLRRGGGSRRVVVDDDDGSPPSPPAGIRPHGGTKMVAVPAPDDSPMEVGGEETMDPTPPTYCDVRRKMELLPPGEEIPPAIRPPIRGKAKILADYPLKYGQTIRIVDESKRKRKEESSPVDHVAEVGKGGAQLLMEQVTPLLQKWLEESLKSMGLPNKPRRDTVADNAKNRSNENRKANQTMEKPTHPHSKGSTGAKREVVQSTTEPNAALWSKAVGRKAEKTALPLPPSAAPKGKAEVTGPSNEAMDPGAWQKVTNRKARKKAAALETRAKVAEPLQGKPPVKEGKSRSAAPPPQGAGTKKAPKRRPPRTAAVTLTCPPDGYAEAMRVAQKAINLRDLGIKELRPKRGATGAIILEVPGPNGAERASALKEKMEEALKDMEGVRVARPVKMADLRVKDLLNSTSIEAVKEAIVSAGGCVLDEIRAGEIRMAPDSMGTLWVQCPLGAANKVAAAGRLRIGWTASRVEILEPRQLQCFRCLERGHVQSACPSAIDRSKTCYRCSGEGHAAKFCTNDPHCVLCEGLGLASGHRVGGKACRAPKRNPKFQKAATTASDDRMEVEIALPAVRGGSPLTRGTPVPVRREQEGNSRPAVRGKPQRAPVPVRPAEPEREEETMEVETFPESQIQPPKEQRAPRGTKGRGEPLDRPSSSPPQE